ncbi:hypothetical protein ACLB2K_016304 [Fragaria x ananassa]
MRPSALQTVATFSSVPKTFTSFDAQPQSQYLHLPKPKRYSLIITMRDRSKNPRPLQKGRNLSIEAIQTIQALKRAQKNESLMEQVFNSKFRRLLKLDMMAVLKDLLRQNECFLALKVFEDIRMEYWYKPQVLLYADMIKPDIEGFNALLTASISFNLPNLAMEYYYLMKGVGCEPDRSSFRMLIKGLESMGETGPLGIVRQDAQNLYGESLEFLGKNEEMAAITILRKWLHSRSDEIKFYYFKDEEMISVLQPGGSAVNLHVLEDGPNYDQSSAASFSGPVDPNPIPTGRRRSRCTVSYALENNAFGNSMRPLNKLIIRKLKTMSLRCPKVPAGTDVNTNATDIKG